MKSPSALHFILNTSRICNSLHQIHLPWAHNLLFFRSPGSHLFFFLDNQTAFLVFISHPGLMQPGFMLETSQLSNLH